MSLQVSLKVNGYYGSIKEKGGYMRQLKEIEPMSGAEFRETTLYLIAVECKWLVREAKDFSDSLPDELPNRPQYKPFGSRSEYDMVMRGLYLYENAVAASLGELNAYLKVLGQPYSGGDVLDLIIFRDSEANYKEYMLNYIHRHRREERESGTDERDKLVQLLDKAYAIKEKRDNNVDDVTED